MIRSLTMVWMLVASLTCQVHGSHQEDESSCLQRVISRCAHGVVFLTLIFESVDADEGSQQCEVHFSEKSSRLRESGTNPALSRLYMLFFLHSLRRRITFQVIFWKWSKTYHRRQLGTRAASSHQPSRHLPKSRATFSSAWTLPFCPELAIPRPCPGLCGCPLTSTLCW